MKTKNCPTGRHADGQAVNVTATRASREVSQITRAQWWWQSMSDFLNSRSNRSSCTGGDLSQDSQRNVAAAWLKPRHHTWKHWGYIFQALAEFMDHYRIVAVPCAGGKNESLSSL